MSAIIDKIHTKRHEFARHNRNNPKHLILDRKSFYDLVSSVPFQKYQRYTMPDHKVTTFDGLIVSIVHGTGFDEQPECIELA